MIRWFNNLKLQTKFLSLFALACILGTGTTAFYIGQVNEIDSDVDLAIQNIQRADSVSSLEKALLQVQNSADSFVASQDWYYVPYLVENTRQAAELLSGLEEGADPTVDNPDFMTALQSLRSAFDDLQTQVDAAQSAYLDGRLDDGLAAVETLQGRMAHLR